MKKTLTPLEKYEAALSCVGESNRRLYLNYADNFIKRTGGAPWDRGAVLRHLERLRKAEYSDGTIKFIYGVIKRLFAANEVGWPLSKGETPIIRESEVYAPALHPELIRRAIAAAVAGDLSTDEAALLALSTIYGHRREELIETTREDVTTHKHMLLVRTVKKGRERWHHLPVVIQPFLMAYSFPALTPHTATAIWLSLEKKAQIPHLEDVGWHSVRRTLIKETGRYCAEMVVHNFFRFSVRTMSQRYFSTRYVGGESDEIVMPEGDQENDLAIFTQHPFLADWGENIYQRRGQ